MEHEQICIHEGYARLREHEQQLLISEHEKLKISKELDKLKEENAFLDLDCKKLLELLENNEVK